MNTEYIREYMVKLHKELEERKEAVIRLKLADMDLQDEFWKDKERRFKKFLFEDTGKTQTLWFDNGTKRGLRIITFEFIHQDPFKMNGQIKVELKYW